MGNNTTANVDELLKQFCSGDPNARRLIIERSLDRIGALSRRQLRGFPAVQRWAQTDDIMQGAAQRLYRALDSVRPPNAREFFKLCSALIRRELIDQKRSLFGPEGIGANHVSRPQASNESWMPHSRALELDHDDSTNDPAKLARWTELHAHIDALPEDLRDVFDLLWYQGLTHAEAGELLGVSEKTISRRWREARLQVHHLVEDGEIWSGDEPMVVDTRVNELLSRWDAADVKPTPEELCREHPELIPSVRDCIHRLRTTDRRLEEVSGDPPRAPEIPGYVTVDLIGRGGMGVVWRATQLGTQRTVALKVVSAGEFVSPRARARFEREVELASRLNHPHVARVYDSGVHLGRLYYAMELVDGQPLDRFVETTAADQSQILQLMQKICGAVHHAHQLGVIHRDLKPSNLLVGSDGEPHVLDFGVAKELSRDGKSQLTLENDAPGTPAYMSPEQAAGQTKRIGTASDVYTLGVILYQLVLAKLPHNTDGSGIEVMHRIATVDPAHPRNVPPGIETDLEAILLMALAREPEHRYPSADELGKDLGRFLAHQPVIARRHTFAYVMRKRLWRHKWKVITVATLLALAISAAAWSYASINRQRARADTEAKIAEAVNRFLLDRLLAANDPAVAKGSNLTLRKLLDRAAAEAGSAFRDQPLVEAQVRTTIGRAYSNLAERDAAPQQLLRAWQIYQRIYGPGDPRTLDVEADYAMALEGDSRFDEAEAAQKALLDRSRRVLGERHAVSLMCLHRLANIAAERGRFDLAEPLFRQSLVARREVLGENHPDTIWSISDLGAVLSALDRAEEAEPLLREAMSRRLQLNGPDTIETINAELNLATALVKLNRFDEAEAMLLHNAESRLRVLGEKHPDRSLPLHALAVMRVKQKKFDEAIDLADQTFQIRYDSDGFRSAGTMKALAFKVHILVAIGRLGDAKAQLRIAEDAVAKAIQAGNLYSIRGLGAYVDALRNVGETTKADEIARLLTDQDR